MKDIQTPSKKTYRPQDKLKGPDEALAESLQEKIQKLQFICAHYDPYQKEIPEEIHHLLLEFNLDPQEHDPFSVTEHLLVLLDQLTTLAKK